MNPDSYYASDIERALVSLVWHQPEHLPCVLQSLLPQHLSDLLCRWTLEAITLAYSEKGLVDFTMVVEVLRELGKFQAAGGLLPLESLYSTWDRLIDQRHCEALLGYYLERLKASAAQLSSPDPVPLTGFTGGSGQLHFNPIKNRFEGFVRISGKTYQTLGFLEQDPLCPKCINLRFYPTHGLPKGPVSKGPLPPGPGATHLAPTN